MSGARGAPRLGAGLIARKGEAAPAPALPPASDTGTAGSEAAPLPPAGDGPLSIHEVVRRGAENADRRLMNRAEKGEAALARPKPSGDDSSSLHEMLGQAPLQTNQARMGKAREAAATTRGTHATVAVTVRLDQARYERLKLHGAKRRRTNQDLIVEALDHYLDANAE